MDWGAIRKAINSDLEKPLDVLIKETSSSGSPTRHQVFTNNGTFTVPAGVTTVYVTAVGGGGGGGGGQAGSYADRGTTQGQGGEGGGGGDSGFGVIFKLVQVTPGERVAVTVGSGGSGGTGGDSVKNASEPGDVGGNGGAGGATSFGTKLSVAGGAGGRGGRASGPFYGSGSKQDLGGDGGDGGNSNFCGDGGNGGDGGENGKEHGLHFVSSGGEAGKRGTPVASIILPVALETYDGQKGEAGLINTATNLKNGGEPGMGAQAYKFVFSDFNIKRGYGDGGNGGNGGPGGYNGSYRGPDYGKPGTAGTQGFLAVSY